MVRHIFLEEQKTGKFTRGVGALLLSKSNSAGKCHEGQLGHGRLQVEEAFPRLVESLANLEILDVAAGVSSAFFIESKHILTILIV